MPFNAILDEIKSALLLEFNEELPIVRINFFAAFRFCVGILQELGKAVQLHPSITSEAKGVSLGFAYVDEILEGIVEHQRDKAKRILMPHWTQLKMTRAVLRILTIVTAYLPYSGL